MTITSRAQIIAVLVVLVLWLAALAFAWATVTSGTMIRLGNHHEELGRSARDRGGMVALAAVPVAAAYGPNGFHSIV